ncbi:MAG TPA: hypothetical protein VK856_12625 [Anaerolineaceae bacterium]|nr:hypothetical protein [Anaerolineaceae bacterium]
MKKTDLILLFILSLIVLSVNFVFQQDPGYMDSEYYFLGGLRLSKGDYTLPVIWNYLDGATNLPHPLFSYWFPFASILSGVSIYLFGSTFLGSRIIFWILAAGLSSLSYYVGYSVTENRFIGVISGLLAVFSGYYLKFFTIPETFLPSIYLGTFFFLTLSKLLEKRGGSKKSFSLLGAISGILQLSRSDGAIFFLLGLAGIIFYLRKEDRLPLSDKAKSLGFFIGAYFLIMAPFFLYNYLIFGSLLPPATSKVMWIATYDDTFTYPSAQLTFSYFLNNGLPLRFDQIIEAVKMNSGSLLGVQLLIIGAPLFLLGLIKNRKIIIFRIGIIHLMLVYLLMSFVFPLAGARGGFLHASAANQIIIWVLIAVGFDTFIKWGIRKRNWKLIRSRKMFGSAFIIFAIFLTVIIYQRDVIGVEINNPKWNQNYSAYSQIESIIGKYAQENSDVVMINNPIGYYYETNRWSVVLPNSSPDDLLSLINDLNVKYLVLDENLPDKFNSDHFIIIENYFNLIYQDGETLKIYEKDF